MGSECLWSRRVAGEGTGKDVCGCVRNAQMQLQNETVRVCAKDVRTRMATYPRAVTGSWVKRPMREVLVEVALNDANRFFLSPSSLCSSPQTHRQKRAAWKIVC
jgi:hypothetical protein